jgi:hypothetical protein
VGEWVGAQRRARRCRWLTGRGEPNAGNQTQEPNAGTERRNERAAGLGEEVIQPRYAVTSLQGCRSGFTLAPPHSTLWHPGGMIEQARQRAPLSGATT